MARARSPAEAGSSSTATLSTWPGSEVPAEERPDPLPAVVRGLGPVTRPVRGEKGVAGAFVAVKLVGLPGLLQRLLQLGDLLRGRVFVVGAEQPEQRAGEILRQCTIAPTLSGMPAGGVPTTKAP